ncbi:MAG: hypothetical protein KBA14_06175, partial [Saprospiraceae bacterium]|nr:hypothetical protein [Saprospiraceae bacterium]
MKKLLMLMLSWLWIIPAMQAQIGKVGINTTAPSAMLHVKDSSVLFTGLTPLPSLPGNPPVSGAGTRMMWYADKGSFRMGNVDGTQWNKDSIGTYSIAVGQNVKAKGLWSIAMGYQNTALGWASAAIGHSNIASGNISMALGAATTASGVQSLATGTNTVASGGFSTVMGGNSIASGEISTAMGQSTTASGQTSTAMGIGTIASGSFSTAIGNNTIASGQTSTAMGGATRAIANGSTATGNNTRATGIYSNSNGLFTVAKPYLSFVLGQYNDTSSISSNTWELLDPLFIVGNGTSNAMRANAFTILKNGKTGINTLDPQAMLHVKKDGGSGGPFNTNAAAIFEGDQGSFIQLSNDNTIQSGILSGNEVTAIRSALIFAADSSILLRTGGNVTRATMSNTGNLGIGTSSPQKKLHVSNGSSGVTPVSTATAVFEDDATLVINLLTPDANSSAIQFGNNSSPVAGGIIYNHGTVPNGLSFRTNGNTTKMSITDVGNVGIGTTAPAAKLDVNGSMKLGANGTTITEMIKTTVSKNVGLVVAN